MKGDSKQSDNSSSGVRKTRIVDSRSQESKLANSKPASNVVTIDYLTLTKEALDLEEKEAVSRTGPNQNEIQFNKTCKEIRTLMAEMVSVDEDEQFSKIRSRILMNLLDLKKLNRFDKLQNKATRDSVSAAKQKVDTYHLQFENLLYETTCLQKEITKCREFKSKVDSVNLVPLEQFYATAPEELSMLEENRTDDHKCTLARLRYELVQRKQLAEELKTGEKRKAECLDKVEQSKSVLDKLHPQFKNVVDVVNITKEKLVEAVGQ